MIWGRIRVHSFLVNLAMLWKLVFLFLCVEALTILASGLMQVLLEVSIGEMFWDFTSLISFLVEVVMTDFWCVLLRGTRLRISGPGKSSKPLLSCFRKTTTLLPLSPSQDEQNIPRSDAKSQLSHLPTKGFLAVAQ